MLHTERLAMALAGLLAVQAMSLADDGNPLGAEATRMRIDPKLAKLIEQLDSGGSRREAMSTLADMGPQAAPAAPRLASFLRDKNWMTRAYAVVALHEIGASAADQVPALVSALGDDQCEVYAGARITLEKLGRLAVPGLIDGLVHPQSEVRRRAADTLSRIGGAARSALPELQLAAADNDNGVRRSALKAIQQLRQAPR